MKLYLQEASNKLGLTMDTMKKLRLMPEYSPYFTARGRVDVTELEKHIDAIKALDVTIADDTSEYWKKRKLKADALMSEIELDELRERYLEKGEVIALLKRIATAQKSVLKSKLVHELPSKLLGLNVTEASVLMENELNEVLAIFQRELNQWT